MALSNINFPFKHIKLCPLMNFVNHTLKQYQGTLPYENIRKVYVMGNTSCDLDSFLSSYLLSLAKNFTNKSNMLYLPLINCTRNELTYRFDIDYVCKRFHINRHSLPYINDKKIMRDLKTNKSAKVILVDHNKPSSSQQNLLANHIIGVYDHHKDENFHFENMNNNKHLMFPLGSCTTLILKKFFIDNLSLFKYVNPLLSISAILLDTENFNKDLYNKKWINDDMNVYKRIIGLNKKKYTQKFIDDYYKHLSMIKYNEKKNLNLGIEGILCKDKKNYVWNNHHQSIRGGWSTLQISFDRVIKKYGYNAFFDKMFNLCQNDHYDIYLCNYSDTFYNNADIKNNIKVKCFIFYNYDMKEEKFENMIKGISSLLGMKCYKREEVVFDKKNNKKVYRFFVHQAISRKHFEPIIREYFSSWK